MKFKTYALFRDIHAFVMFDQCFHLLSIDGCNHNPINQKGHQMLNNHSNQKSIQVLSIEFMVIMTSCFSLNHMTIKNSNKKTIWFNFKFWFRFKIFECEQLLCQKDTILQKIHITKTFWWKKIKWEIHINHIQNTLINFPMWNFNTSKNWRIF